MNVRFHLAIVAIVALAIFVISLIFIAAEALADGDPKRKAWFKSLALPSGLSCCDESDCRRTEAEFRDGQWHAIVESVHGRAWMPIPPERVLKEPRSIDGEAYVCATPGSKGGTVSQGVKLLTLPPSQPHIFCFVPPILGY